MAEAGEPRFLRDVTLLEHVPKTPAYGEERLSLRLQCSGRRASPKRMPLSKAISTPFRRDVAFSASQRVVGEDSELWEGCQSNSSSIACRKKLGARRRPFVVERSRQSRQIPCIARRSRVGSAAMKQMSLLVARFYYRWYRPAA